MRILFVGNLYPPIVFGGYEILCSQVVEGLKRRGHEIHIATSRHRQESAPPSPEVERILHLTTDFPHPGQSVHSVDFRPASLQRVARINRQLLEPIVERFRPDRIFCWCLNRLGLAPLQLAQKHGIAAAYTLNDEHPKQYGSGKLGWRRLVYPESTLAALRPFPVTVISHALRNRLLDQGLPLWHARVIYQGIPLERFPYQPLPRLPEQPLRLLYVGQLSANKGVHTLLEAVAQSQYQVTLVGDGVADYEERLRQLAGPSDRVTFLGRVPHQRVAALYREHHVLVFPSIWEEPFGLSHLEAMASGCAVVSTTTGGSAELIRSGHNAIAFQPGQSQELRGALDHLSNEEGLRQNLLANARSWVQERHSLEGYIERLEGFLLECQPN